MPESDYVLHYHHIQGIHQRLLDHSWSRQQTRYDSAFIAWLDKQLLMISNEAYHIVQEEC
ncbi:hypothetical protein LCGC14_3148720 [marine sediment metagenome]|uniref:Uncharacterized protein n=1 Tax=marine sediment metagenome TaxID=412755 RepID=A0A0F8VUT8_9ZZZZ